MKRIKTPTWLLCWLIPLVFGFSSLVLCSHLHWDTDQVHVSSEGEHSLDCSLCKLGTGSGQTSAVSSYRLWLASSDYAGENFLYSSRAPSNYYYSVSPRAPPSTYSLI